MNATALASCSLALWCVVAVAAPTDETVLAFEKFLRVSTESTISVTRTYLNKRVKKWAKYRFAVLDLRYDVKKTDSLVNPIIGLIHFTLRVDETELVKTKEEAEQLNEFNTRSGPTFNIFLTYTFKDEGWKFKDGEFEVSALRGKKFPLTTENISREPNTIPNTAVKLWLTPASPR